VSAQQTCECNQQLRLPGTPVTPTPAAALLPTDHELAAWCGPNHLKVYWGGPEASLGKSAEVQARLEANPSSPAWPLKFATECDVQLRHANSELGVVCWFCEAEGLPSSIARDIRHMHDHFISTQDVPKFRVPGRAYLCASGWCRKRAEEMCLF
jgi:hypothetical protein